MSQRHRRQQLLRSGSLTLEAVVAASVLSLVAACSGPLIVRLAGLRTEHQARRQAIETLSNELDRLAALPSGELEAAVERIEVGDPEGAAIEARLAEEGSGRRIVLTLSWPDRANQRPPVTLVGWSFSEDPE